jgi:hypothetical protein
MALSPDICRQRRHPPLDGAFTSPVEVKATRTADDADLAAAGAPRESSYLVYGRAER